LRPYQVGENFYNLIKTAIPNFVEADYPLFIEFVSAYLRFLETHRTFEQKSIYPEYGASQNRTVNLTQTLGGTSYELRKLLDYRDTESTIDEFKTHFLAMFAKNFPHYNHIPLDLFVQSLR